MIQHPGSEEATCLVNTRRRPGCAAPILSRFTHNRSTRSGPGEEARRPAGAYHKNPPNRPRVYTTTRERSVYLEREGIKFTLSPLVLFLLRPWRSYEEEEEEEEPEEEEEDGKLAR